MTQLNFVYGAAPSYAKIKDTVKGHSEKRKKNTVVTIHQAMCCTNESEIFFTLLEA